jgi:hypothetical protein
MIDLIFWANPFRFLICYFNYWNYSNKNGKVGLCVTIFLSASRIKMRQPQKSISTSIPFAF